MPIQQARGHFPGTVAAPGLYLGTDTTTGLYQIGNGNIGLSIAGTKLLDLSSATFAVTGAGTFSTTLGVTGITTLAAALVGPASATVFNTVSTTVNAFGAATTLNIGNSGGTNTVLGNTVLTGTGGNNTVASILAVKATTGSNGTQLRFTANDTAAYILSEATTAYKPLKIFVNNAEAMGIATSGAVTIPGTLGVTGLITATTAGISVPTSIAGTVYSDTYTPSKADLTGSIAGGSTRAAQFSRTGKFVTVSGQLQIDTTAGGATSFTLTLPVASNLTNGFDLGGSASCYVNTTTFYPVFIVGYTSTDTAEFRLNCGSGANTYVISYTYSYQII